jgi:hypothetical protein
MYIHLLLLSFFAANYAADGSLCRMTRQQQQLPGAAKRPFTSVTGHSLPAAAGSKAKANKEAAAARPAAQRAAAALLPPQLKGR